MKAERNSAIPAAVIVLAASAALLLPGAVRSEEKVKCRLRAASIVKGKTVRIEDVAKCAGGPADLRRRILTTRVGRAPGPGRELKLDPDWLLVKIRRRGIDRRRILWEAPRSLTVTAASRRVPKEAMEKAFRDFVRNRLPWAPEEVRIRDVRAKGDVIVPAGDVHLEVEPPRRADLLGRVSLPVRISVDGRLVQRVWVAGEVLVRTRVWVLDRPVRRGHVLAAADLRQVEVDLGSVPAGIVREVREVVGKRARRSIRGRVPIRRDWLERVPLVRRGDVVMLKAESGTVLVTTVGVVRTDGALGDLVEVVNLSSKKPVYGRVVDRRTVKVIF